MMNKIIKGWTIDDDMRNSSFKIFFHVREEGV